MKTFLLFAFLTYYPSGGMKDFVDDFETLEQAKECALKLTEDNIQIYDSNQRKI